MAVESVVHAHAVKIDPGSKTTGMAVVNDLGLVVWAGEIEHRGQQIRDRLLARRQQRRSRRSRKTRYRPARFDNRRRAEGWLPPSLMSRVTNIATWVSRLQRVAPVASLSLELVKFDTQALVDPEISGVEYQQGTLYGYEVREYLLEKWGRKCAYCGANDVPLQIEHLIPRSRGGTMRVDNLTLACGPCNQKKGNQTAAEFGYPHLHAQARQSLRDAAAVNATRWALYQRLCETGLPVECGTGGRTKFNRVSLGLPKAHWMDAACVGESGANVQIPPALSPLLIRPRGTVRARCAAWTDTVSRAPGKRNTPCSWFPDRGYGARRCAGRQKGRNAYRTGRRALFREFQCFRLPVEHCRGLAGDIASFFTVPMAILFI